MKKSLFFNSGPYGFSFIMIISSMLILASCKSGGGEEEKDNAIEVVTNLMDFQMIDEIPAGWNTFHYMNKSQETHFILLDKYPEGKHIEDGKKEVVPVFQSGMDLINAGKPDEAMAEFGKLPGWFSDIVFVGGSGLVSPDHSSLTTLKLDPGYYVMECYVKMPNGTFHGTMGMLKAFTVVDTINTNEPPVPTVHITLSGDDGMTVSDSIQKGKNIFSVFFKDQKVYENFVGHDVHLARLEANSSLDALEKWMNWADPKGLITPAPEELVFMGGVNDMPAGRTGYFTVDLEPGNYALIAEVPNTSEKGLLKTFTVSE